MGNTILFYDIEADGFLHKLTKIHTIQIANTNPNEPVEVYADIPGYPSLEAAVSRLQTADATIGHNILQYDLPALERFYPGRISRLKSLDTLTLSRFLNPWLEGGHSLRAWGMRLGIPKAEYTGDFAEITPELIDYAEQDVIVQRALFTYLMDRLEEHPFPTLFDIELEFAQRWTIPCNTISNFNHDIRYFSILPMQVHHVSMDIEPGIDRLFLQLNSPLQSALDSNLALKYTYTKVAKAFPNVKGTFCNAKKLILNIPAKGSQEIAKYVCDSLVDSSDVIGFDIPSSIHYKFGDSLAALLPI